VIAILEKKLKRKINIKFDKMRVGDQKYFVSKNDKVKKLLGWQPKTDFKKGLEILIDWQKNNLKYIIV